MTAPSFRSIVTVGWALMYGAAVWHLLVPGARWLSCEAQALLMASLGSQMGYFAKFRGAGT